MEVGVENRGLRGASVPGAVWNDDLHAGNRDLLLRQRVDLVSPTAVEKDQRAAGSKLPLVTLSRDPSTPRHRPLIEPTISWRCGRDDSVDGFPKNDATIPGEGLG